MFLMVWIVEIEIILNGTFTLTGSSADVASGIYTDQAGTMALGSSISIIRSGVSPISANNFLPTSAITLNASGTLDFDKDTIYIQDTSSITLD